MGALCWKEYIQLECPICLESFDGKTRSPYRLECGHKFCKGCIKLWIDQSDEDTFTCPVCKEVMASYTVMLCSSF
jgi:hypothetical protein